MLRLSTWLWSFCLSLSQDKSNLQDTRPSLAWAGAALSSQSFLSLVFSPIPSSFHGPPSLPLPSRSISALYKVGAERRFTGQSSPVLVGLIFCIWGPPCALHACCCCCLVTNDVAAGTAALNPSPAEDRETNWHCPSWLMAALELWQEKSRRDCFLRKQFQRDW